MEETGDVLGAMSEDVTLGRYPGMAHGVNQDELEHARLLLRQAAAFAH